MKKNDKAKQERKPQGRVPKQRQGVTELTDRELGQVQGGHSIVSPRDPQSGLPTG